MKLRHRLVRLEQRLPVGCPACCHRRGLVALVSLCVRIRRGAHIDKRASRSTQRAEVRNAGADFCQSVVES
jgi:hypothetical protein